MGSGVELGAGKEKERQKEKGAGPAWSKCLVRLLVDLSSNDSDFWNLERECLATVWRPLRGVVHIWMLVTPKGFSTGPEFGAINHSFVFFI